MLLDPHDEHENGMAFLPVSLRRDSTVRYSLIRKEAQERVLSEELIEGDRHYDITLPETAIPLGIHPEICISESVLLTWSRRRNNPTHRTRFFLVSNDVLRTDVLLGYEDSGEGYLGAYARGRCDPTRPLD